MRKTKELTLYLKKEVKGKSGKVNELVPKTVVCTFIKQMRDKVQYSFINPITNQKTVGTLPVLHW